MKGTKAERDHKSGTGTKRVTATISVDELRRRRLSKVRVERENEFRCPECGVRCTRGIDGVEYGHMTDCPDRPDDFPRHSGRRAATDGGDSA